MVLRLGSKRLYCVIKDVREKLYNNLGVIKKHEVEKVVSCNLGFFASSLF